MDVKKARKILGKEAKHLSDQEVEKIIHNSETLADIALDMFEEKLKKKKQNP